MTRHFRSIQSEFVCIYILHFVITWYMLYQILFVVTVQVKTKLHKWINKWMNRWMDGWMLQYSTRTISVQLQKVQNEAVFLSQPQSTNYPLTTMEKWSAVWFCLWWCTFTPEQHQHVRTWLQCRQVQKFSVHVRITVWFPVHVRITFWFPVPFKTRTFRFKSLYNSVGS